jgi:hypothetical protein
MPSALAALLSRTDARGGFIDPCLSNLENHIGQFETIARQLLRIASDRNVVIYGPYIGRSILESGLTAVRLRFDPFRSGSLHQFARHPKYDPNDVLRSRFQWMGDIFPEEAPPQDIWNPEQKPQGISRALFSAHLIDLAWLPAAEALTDFITTSGEVIDVGFFQTETPKTALARYHGEIRQLYSFLSKGVHGEFFFSPSSPLDAETCREKLFSVINFTSQLGLASHFAYGYASGISPKSATRLYQRVQRMINE